LDLCRLFGDLAGSRVGPEVGSGIARDVLEEVACCQRNDSEGVGGLAVLRAARGGMNRAHLAVQLVLVDLPAAVDLLFQLVAFFLLRPCERHPSIAVGRAREAERRDLPARQRREVELEVDAGQLHTRGNLPRLLRRLLTFVGVALSRSCRRNGAMSVEQRGHRLDWLAHTPMHSNCDVSVVHIHLSSTADGLQPLPQQRRDSAMKRLCHC
jgi:hypothetical protein